MTRIGWIYADSMKRNMLIIFLLFSIFFFLPELADAQCAMCNETVKSGTENNPENAKSLNNGIIFLMVIPYLLLGTFVFLWWKYRKQAREDHREHKN